VLYQFESQRNSCVVVGGLFPIVIQQYARKQIKNARLRASVLNDLCKLLYRYLISKHQTELIPCLCSCDYVLGTVFAYCT
jgi:hypothetical protein